MAKVTKVAKPTSKVEVEHKGKVSEQEVPQGGPALDTGIKLGLDLGYTKHLGDHEFLKVTIRAEVPVDGTGALTTDLETLNSSVTALAAWAEQRMDETVSGFLETEAPPWEDNAKPAAQEDDVDVLAALSVEGNENLGLGEDALEEADSVPPGVNMVSPSPDDPLGDLGDGWMEGLQEPEVDTTVDETDEDDPLGLKLFDEPQGASQAAPEADDDPLGGLGLNL